MTAVVLIDFGIATMGEVAGERGSFVGSFGYAAPEQLHGRHAEIGPATDAFAMKHVFQLFTGVKPFDAQTLAERLAPLMRLEYFETYRRVAFRIC